MDHEKPKSKADAQGRPKPDKEGLHDKALEMLIGGKSCAEIASELGVTRAAVSLWALNAGLKRSVHHDEAKCPSLLEYHLSLLRDGKTLEMITDNTGRSWLKVPKGDTLGGHIGTVMKASRVCGWGVRSDISSGSYLIPTYAYHFELARALDISNFSRFGGKVLGGISTPKKAKSSRENGKKGGRPKGVKRAVD